VKTGDVIQQRDWTETELKRAGFQFYQRKRQVVMARILPESEAPLRIEVGGQETVMVQAGYIICYNAGQTVQTQLNEYEHWPCQPDIFQHTYLPWNDVDWQPNAAERDLLAHGCKPYYKSQGVWAKRLTTPTYVQSIESAAPVLVSPGHWLVIGDQGAPYHMTDAAFCARYVLP
jgi:hypothetical protein